MAPNDEKTTPEHTQTPVGQYYLLDKIAQGGMAEIFKGLAYDLHGIKRTVVIKKILPNIAADPEFVQMLINEAKIAVMLSHGNIAQIYDLGKVGNDYFMVMEFVDGKSLSQIHKRALKYGEDIPIEYACYFVAEVASGLNYMHRRTDEQGRNLGIVHRDISPQNVIISYSGTVKIIDFGIAKAAIQLNITDSGVLKGKFAYMSPEQAKGEAIDHRTDIFSLGVILHELITGRRLFKGANKKETLANVRSARVDAPSTLRKDVPKALDDIVRKALSKDPKKRYFWADELRDDLMKFVYQNYHEFQPSSITGYIHELFKEDIAEQEEMEDEALTPHLIIDHTQSAILAEKMENTGILKVPPQLREFMLDDETPIEKIELSEKAEDELSEKIETPKRKIEWKRVIQAINITILIGALIGTGVYYYPKLDFGHIYQTIKTTLSFKTSAEAPVAAVQEQPHYAEITITSEPAGATIILDEMNTNSKTPATIKNLKPNTEYTIGLTLDKHAYWNEKISLGEDEKKSIHAEMLLNYGSLEIIADPAGSLIYIDDLFAGISPFRMQKVEPGKIFRVTVKKDGYESWENKIEVDQGSNMTIRPKLLYDTESKIPKFMRDIRDEEKQLQEQQQPEEPAPDENMLPPSE